MTADPFYRRQIDACLHQMRDRCMTQRVANDFLRVQPRGSYNAHERFTDINVCVCPYLALTDGNSHGVPLGKFSKYAVRNDAKSGDIGCVRAPAFAAGI